MKVIEVIYPEFQNVYADLYQVQFLKKCNPDFEIVYTHYNEEPHFVKNNVDLVFMGSMPDSKIHPCIDKLMPYKDRIKKMVEENTFFLITGNALEVFSAYILENNQRNEALGIFDYHIEKNMEHKVITWYVGKFGEIDIVGHKNQYSSCNDVKNGFIENVKGYGNNSSSTEEGIHYKNFYATYLLGPFLIMNPLFTKYLLKEMDVDSNIAFEEDLMNAYNDRINYFKKPDAKIMMGDRG